MTKETITRTGWAKKALSLTLAFLLILTASVVVFPVQANASGNFTDLPSTHWAYESVKKMQEKEIIKGYADGTFRPAQTVTYGEFIKMTITALDGKDDVAEVTSPTHWASKYYKAALARNLFSSGQIAEKSLNLSIPRYDMALIAANAVKAGNVNNYEELMESLPDVDTKTVNSYQILQAYAEGMITGYEDSTFRAFGTLSRAEASAVIYRLIDKSARKVPSIGGTSKEEPTVSETPKQKTDSDGTPALGSKWEDKWGTYRIAKTTELVSNWDQYLTAWEDQEAYLNWNEKMKVYETEMPYKYLRTWEQGTEISKTSPVNKEPFLTVDVPFGCYMAFIVKDNKILNRVNSCNPDFSTGGCTLKIINEPSSYDYILFVEPAPANVKGMNKEYKETVFKVNNLDDAVCSAPFMFANPFK